MGPRQVGDGISQAVWLTARTPCEDALVQAQKNAVKQSLVRAFDELKNGQARHDARNLFTDWFLIITLMTIYDKSEMGNVSDAYLKSLVAEIAKH
jgi:hypothetical protein